MLRPSYSELMQILNNDPDLDSKITSRYAIVIAASKRARQLIDGAEPKAAAATNKAVSIAVNEMYDGLIQILPEGDKPDDVVKIIIADKSVMSMEDYYVAEYGQGDYGDDLEDDDLGDGASFDEDVTLLDEYMDELADDELDLDLDMDMDDELE